MTEKERGKGRGGVGWGGGSSTRQRRLPFSELKFANSSGTVTRDREKNWPICHLHIFHNRLCLPPEFCISVFFLFLLGIAVVQEKLKTILMQIFFGGGGVGTSMCIMGDKQEAKS